MRWRRCLLTGLLFLWPWAPARLRAAPCPAPPGAAARLAQIDAAARLRFIDGELARAARRARIWSWTWAGIYGTLTTVNLVRLGLTADRDERIDDAVGAGAAAVGVAAIAVSPPAVLADQRRLARLRRSGGDVCALLAQAERLLDRDAARAVRDTGPLLHGGNFGFNMGLFLLLGAGFGHWQQGALTSFVGILVGELQGLTRPKGEIEANRRYRAADLRVTAAPAPPRWQLAPMLSPRQQGLQLVISF